MSSVGVEPATEFLAWLLLRQTDEGLPMWKRLSVQADEHRVLVTLPGYADVVAWGRAWGCEDEPNSWPSFDAVGRVTHAVDVERDGWELMFFADSELAAPTGPLNGYVRDMVAEVAGPLAVGAGGR